MTFVLRRGRSRVYGGPQLTPFTQFNPHYNVSTTISTVAMSLWNCCGADWIGWRVSLVATVRIRHSYLQYVSTIRLSCSCDGCFSFSDFVIRIHCRIRVDELTGRQHRPSTRLVETRAGIDGPCWRVMEIGHPSTRAVKARFPLPEFTARVHEFLCILIILIIKFPKHHKVVTSERLSAVESVDVWLELKLTVLSVVGW